MPTDCWCPEANSCSHWLFLGLASCFFSCLNVPRFFSASPPSMRSQSQTHDRCCSVQMQLLAVRPLCLCACCCLSWCLSCCLSWCLSWCCWCLGVSVVVEVVVLTFWRILFNFFPISHLSPSFLCAVTKFKPKSEFKPKRPTSDRQGVRFSHFVPHNGLSNAWCALHSTASIAQ